MNWSEYVDETLKEATRLRTEAIDICLTEPFDWKSHSTKIEVGTLVAYSKTFLRSIRCSGTDPIWFARGYVMKFRELSPEVVLASIKWKKIKGHTLINTESDKKKRPRWKSGPDIPGSDFPGWVNVNNLARVGPNFKFAAD